MKKLILGALIITSLTFAGPVTGLCGTGQSNCSGSLVSTGSVDPHYTIVSGPVTGSAIVGVNPAWTATDTGSQWIDPVGGTTNVPGGYYTYQTTFTASTPNFVIDGLWAADNAGYDIILNGKSLLSNQISGSGLFPWGVTGFTTLKAFVISSGFVTGVNTLDFVIQNGNFSTDTNAPSGLLVSMTAVSSTPEPGTLALTSSLLFIGLAFARKASRPVSV
jgi:hypothetical protein